MSTSGQSILSFVVKFLLPSTLQDSVPPSHSPFTTEGKVRKAVSSAGPYSLRGTSLWFRTPLLIPFTAHRPLQKPLCHILSYRAPTTPPPPLSTCHLSRPLVQLNAFPPDTRFVLIFLGSHSVTTRAISNETLPWFLKDLEPVTAIFRFSFSFCYS